MNRPGFELPPRSWTNFKGIHEKYQSAFKLKVVKSFLAGDGEAKMLARRWSVPEEKIRAHHNAAEVVRKVGRFAEKGHFRSTHPTQKGFQPI
jgi:hypothetical protein